VIRTAVLPACAALTVSLLLAGCEAGASSASSSPSPSAGAISGDRTEPVGATGGGDGEGGENGGAPVPSFPADTSPDTAEASADALVTVTDIRTGRHDGFDRVVFEMGGAGVPGWDVRYVGAASSQGSGEPIAVAGEAVLQVTVTGAGYPYETGVEEFPGPDPLPGSGTANVTEIAFDATFEGTTVAFVGTGAESPFRVYALQDPTRVVVEIVDAS
jgi:hypothetical protein